MSKIITANIVKKDGRLFPELSTGMVKLHVGVFFRFPHHKIFLLFWDVKLNFVSLKENKI